MSKGAHVTLLARPDKAEEVGTAIGCGSALCTRRPCIRVILINATPVGSGRRQETPLPIDLHRAGAVVLT
jgi:hypothetical protein